ncbi:Flp1 family type IVb pilin [Paenibacillus aurantius]|uniref:Flp1 family type IVb pilin n=1 Tax=Paenibacillus aurantius TaxID=2918900 RepID=A0AA96RCW3_9BACL|nr:Flp1 family type IVb pilin [Paenibacillus aurantius]WJH34059.1 Flp1 family type IVb pilin [Paenibacillus sp. CC-CFT747]WNQ09132.1 Flp1 family type IVb pilin [Paenibacillus aurantius]
MWKSIQRKAKAFWKEEDGLGTLEMLLILAVVVIVAIAFREWIMKWVGGLFKGADTQINQQTTIDGSSIRPSASATP